MIRIILIRHGRTDWNTGEGQDERFRGMLDMPLAEAGAAQAQVTADHLARRPLAAVYSSPLQRALRTAEIIAAPHRLAVRALPGLSSMNYGEWAGRLHADVARALAGPVRRLAARSIQHPDPRRRKHRRPARPGHGRAARGRSPIMPTEKRSSSSPIRSSPRCWCAAWPGCPTPPTGRVRQDLCNLSRFDYDPATDTFNVVGLNDTCHLTPAVGRAAGDGTQIILVRHGQTGWNAGAGARALPRPHRSAARRHRPGSGAGAGCPVGS